MLPGSTFAGDPPGVQFTIRYATLSIMQTAVSEACFDGEIRIVKYHKRRRQP